MSHRSVMVTASISTLAVLLLGCGEKKTPITPQEAQAFADAWAPTVEPTLLDRTEGASVGRELEAVITARAGEAAKNPRDEPPYEVFVKEVYTELEFKPRLVVGGKLSKAGEAVWADIQAVDQHVIDSAPYHIEEITEALPKLAEQAGDSDTSDLAATDADKQWVVKWLEGKNHEDIDLKAEDAHDAMTDALVESGDAAHLAEAMKAHEAHGAKVAKATAQLEWMLARDFVKFSRDVGNRHVREQFIHPRHDDYWNDPEIRRQKERPLEARAAYEAGKLWRRAAAAATSMRNETKIIHGRLRQALRDVVSAEDPAAVVAAQWPSHPQYKALLKERERYKAIVDAGGWKTVPPKKRLKVGSSAATVKQLKERLQIEGYFPDGKASKKYDAALKDAVTAYQRTHQLEVTGTPTSSFWRSLNVPAKRRLKQIELNIERWRYTNAAHHIDERYVFVNIPDFTAELWDSGERKIRMAVVVGNNDLVDIDEDEDGEPDDKEYSNRTPYPIAAYIDRAIYNPYWNVTPRVRKNEILPEVKEWVEKMYEKKRLKKIEEAEKYAALRAALEGKKPPTPTPTPTFTSTAPTGSPTGAAPTNPSAVGAAPAAESSENAPTLSAASHAAFRANPEEYPYYNVETGEVDVSTTIEGNVPGWYETENYEVMHPGKKWEYVRMTPGEHNALGLVKVIFPNLHDVYLHDTNAKPLFKKELRAFSHGCMRMEQPLDFARALLEHDGVYDEVPAAVKEGTYLPVFLKKQVPVYVEYYTVRVDDEGRANFLADIYKVDERGIVVPKEGELKKRPS